MRFVLSALMALMAWVSAATITLPLFSRANKHAAQGSTKSRLPRDPVQPDLGKVYVPLTDWVSPRGSDQQWYTSFQVGTPPQVLTVYLSTATPLFILPNSNCTSGCDHMTLFDPDKSSTYYPFPGTKLDTVWTTGITSIPLSMTESFNCTFVQDTVSLAWDVFKVHDQTFALCDSYPPLMGEGDSTASGIMGLAPLGPSDNMVPWFWNLVDHGQPMNQMFSFYIPPLNLAGGSITLGGYDTTKFTGGFMRMTNFSDDATPDVFPYLLDLSAVYANGTILNANLTADDQSSLVGYALLDIGTASMQAPDHDTAMNLYAQISSEIYPIGPAGAWGAPCDRMDSIAPDLTFTLGNSYQPLNVTIPKRYFNLGEYPSAPGTCQAIINSPVPGNELSLEDKGVWIAGSPLLDKYYTVWDGVNMQIAWGQIEGMPGFDEYPSH